MSGEQCRPAPQSLELGPRQRWGWLLRKEQKQQAEGLCPLRDLVGSIWRLPAALPHLPCGTHAAFSVRVVKPGPSKATLVA